MALNFPSFLDWQLPSVHPKVLAKASQKLSSPLLAQLLAQRLSDPDQIDSYLHPRLDQLKDPRFIPKLEAAVERLATAVAEKEDILIVGDYDVDGASSVALLAHLLTHLGHSPRTLIPHRQKDGYGLTSSLIQRIKARAPNLLLALDCGTNDAALIQEIKALGVDCIVIDHHRLKAPSVPPAILINPHVFKASYSGAENLCTVGLCFKVAHALVQLLRQRAYPAAHSTDLRAYLDYVALGTIADLVPLTEENRIYVHWGLRQLKESTHVGLHALLKVSQLDGRDLNSRHVAFQLAPRINAAGRLGDAKEALDLLLCEDSLGARKLAMDLDERNKARKHLENTLYQQATQQATHMPEEALVLSSDEWHTGVLGIVAGRIARDHAKPCIALRLKNGLLEGSGRSIPGIDLQKALASCEHLLERWGGHAMAVGLSLAHGQLPAFKAILCQSISQQLHIKKVEPPKLWIDAWLEPQDLNEALLIACDTLEPFGQAARAPLFALKSLIIPEKAKKMGKGQVHCRFFIPGTCPPLEAVAWNIGDALPPLHTPVDLAVQLSRNYYRGRVSLQAELVAWRPSCRL